MNFIYDHPHLNLIRVHFKHACKTLTPIICYYRRLIASDYVKYTKPLVKVIDIGCRNGKLLSLLPYNHLVGIDLTENQIQRVKIKIPGGTFFRQAGESSTLEEQYNEILISDTHNYSDDIQMLLNNLQAISNEDTRLLIKSRNTLWALFNHYHDCVYGQTNINRWRHGWVLLKMLVYRALRFKFI